MYQKAGRDYFCNNVHESSVWYAIKDHRTHLVRVVYHQNGENTSFRRHFLASTDGVVLMNDISINV